MKQSKIAEYVQADRQGGRDDKGFGVSFVASDELASVHTSIASQMRRLLKHSEFTAESLTVVDTDGEYRSLSPEEFDADGFVVGVKGHIPIGYLKVQSSGRESNAPSQVISLQ